MLDRHFTPRLLSAAILKDPLVGNGTLAKGALIMNHVDDVVRLLPELRALFFIIERRGWFGFAHSSTADLKLVEDCATLEMTRKLFPKAISLPLSNADFVDTSAFLPLGLPEEYDVIQIACWSKRKRIELLIEAAAKLPNVSFVQLGGFEDRGTKAELEYRDECIRLAASSGARVSFPFGHHDGNQGLPSDKQAINQWINKARLGVLTTSKEGHNRFKMECMAADRPVLIARDAGATTQKHLNAKTGSLFEPNADALADAISEALVHRDRFAPRGYVLEHAGRLSSLGKLKRALEEVCAKAGQPYHFGDIDWDGRNERYTWGEPALALLTDAVRKYRGGVRRPNAELGAA